MNPIVEGENKDKVYKDAIFLSPHKFVGGVGSPGILVAKKHLFKGVKASTSPGGGTVFFVSNYVHN